VTGTGAALHTCRYPACGRRMAVPSTACHACCAYRHRAGRGTVGASSIVAHGGAWPAGL